MDWLVAQFVQITGDNLLLASLITGLFVAFTTSLGSLGVFFYRSKSPDMSLSLAFASGIMLVASFTSLIIPATRLAGFPLVATGIALGVVAIHLTDSLIPHEHLVRGYEGHPAGKRLLKKVWLIAMAIIIHNFPEGLAVGTSVAYSIPLGLATAIAIGIQDIPEGLAVSLPVSATSGKRMGVFIGVLSGLSETLMAVVGALLFSQTAWLLPLGMGFAGGAMLYVTLKEAIPEVYREEEPPLKITLGFLIGFYLMLFLDSIF
ncbi:MAG: ZIP family metal transporter [Infirmifilum sp.]